MNNSNIVIYNSIHSTQDKMIEHLKLDFHKSPGTIIALEQTHGRGTGERIWYSTKEQSFNCTIAFKEILNHTKPWLIGFSIAICIAEELNCNVCWPNDIIHNNKKVGGIITEIIETEHGNVPVVGIGINYGNVTLPDSLPHAGCLNRGDVNKKTALEIYQKILNRFISHPIPYTWRDVKERWEQFDASSSKIYHDDTGNIVKFKGYTDDGALLVENFDGELIEMLTPSAQDKDSVQMIEATSIE